jgi:hypothetical protein
MGAGALRGLAPAERESTLFPKKRVLRGETLKNK